MLRIDVFISYSSKNSEAAKAVCHALEENGVRCWMAPRDIPPGCKYGDMIDKAIVSAKVFLLVYSADSLKSPWCNGELNVAFTEGKTIVPYRIDSAPLEGAMRVMLNQTHWIDSFPNYKQHFAELTQTICSIVGVNADKGDESVGEEEYGHDKVQETVKVNDSEKLSKKEWWVLIGSALFGMLSLILPWMYALLFVMLAQIVLFVLYFQKRQNAKKGKPVKYNLRMIRYMIAGFSFSTMLLLLLGMFC